MSKETPLSQFSPSEMTAQNSIAMVNENEEKVFWFNSPPSKKLKEVTLANTSMFNI
jgi:hypothetical protein